MPRSHLAFWRTLALAPYREPAPVTDLAAYAAARRPTTGPTIAANVRAETRPRPTTTAAAPRTHARSMGCTPPLTLIRAQERA